MIFLWHPSIIFFNSPKTTARLVGHFKHTSKHFKHTYTYFHIFFYSHIYIKNTQTALFKLLYQTSPNLYKMRGRHGKKFGYCSSQWLLHNLPHSLTIVMFQSSSFFRQSFCLFLHLFVSHVKLCLFLRVFVFISISGQ